MRISDWSSDVCSSDLGRRLWEKRLWADGANLRPHGRQQSHIGAGDAAVANVSANGDLQPFDPALAAADGERVQQRLGRMFASAVTEIGSVSCMERLCQYL